MERKNKKGNTHTKKKYIIIIIIKNEKQVQLDIGR